LLRGETYRWGCDAFGVAKQREVMAAFESMLVRPLEHAGHCVHAYMYLHRGCPDRDAELQGMLADRLALAHRRRMRTLGSQAANMRQALDFFLAAPLATEYDSLIFDVKLLTPYFTWGCRVADHSTISLASKCSPDVWEAFNCTSDILQVLPRKLIPAFSAQVGVGLSYKDMRCCFTQRCLDGSGHGCLNLLAPHIGSVHNVQFCWPQPPKGQTLSWWNPNYAVPQCNDLPGDKPGSMWRCKADAATSYGRNYSRQSERLDLSYHPPCIDLKSPEWCRAKMRLCHTDGIRLRCPVACGGCPAVTNVSH